MRVIRITVKLLWEILLFPHLWCLSRRNSGSLSCDNGRRFRCHQGFDHPANPRDGLIGGQCAATSIVPSDLSDAVGAQRLECVIKDGGTAGVNLIGVTPQPKAPKVQGGQVCAVLEQLA